MATKRRRKSSGGAKRRSLDIGKAKRKHEEVSKRNRSEFHDLDDGWNYFIVLPPWSDEDVIWKEVQQHKWQLNCPKTSHDKPCVICNELQKRKKRGDVEFDEEFRLKSRAFLNAVRKEDIKKRNPENIKVLGLSGGVFNELLEYIDDEEIDISDPAAAVLFCIKRTGRGFSTRYKVKFGDTVDVSQYITDEVMEGLYDLDAIRAAQPASTKDLRAALRKAADGGADDDYDDDDGDDDDDDFDDDLSDDEEGEEEEDDEVGEDDDEIEDELFEDPDDEVGEDEEEEPEEEEEEPEEEEEEPEPPKRRRKKKTTKKKVSKKTSKKKTTRRRR